MTAIPEPPRNQLLHGDCLQVMATLPEDSIDVIFADPPYNLQKAYTTYADDLPDQAYIKWCNQWLYQLSRLLKPTGSLFVVNLPKWCIHHAVFLDQYLWRQQWIVWDALSVPRGKMMPAHYGILYYTKQAQGYTFNPLTTKTQPTYCLRQTCVKQRATDPTIEAVPLTSLWVDLHRIRHRKNRDPHPCQLPLALLERIILLASHPRELVFDPFMGVGTTAIVAKLLQRDYLGIELNSTYITIAQEKLQQSETYRSQLRIESLVSPVQTRLIEYLDES